MRLAETLGKLDASLFASLGESQVYQVRAALALYHYVNPKLLVLTSAIKLTLDGERIGKDGRTPGATLRLVRGVPGKMYPMEMVTEDPDDELLREPFDDIKGTLLLPSINSDYQTLALWPDYLAAAWSRLKPKIERDEYREASHRLGEMARSLARGLPHPIPLTRQRSRNWTRMSKVWRAPLHPLIGCCRRWCPTSP